MPTGTASPRTLPPHTAPAPLTDPVATDTAATDTPATATDTPTDTPTTRRPRRRGGSTRLPQGLVALGNTHFRIYLVSLFLGGLGVWIQRMAQDWLVLQLTGSASAVGLAVALQFAPVLVLGLYGGVLVDRFDARRLLLISQSVMAVLAAVLAVLVTTGTATVGACYALALGVGLCTVVEQPARLQLVTQLVGLERLRSALGLNSTAFQSAGLAGPVVAGLVIHTLGLGWCYWINMVTCAIVVVACVLMRRGVPVVPRDAAAAQAGPIAQLKEGLDHIRGASEIAWSIALVAVMGVFGSNLAVLLSSFSTKEFHTGVSGYTTFNALVAGGMVAGALLGGRRSTTMRLRQLTGLVAALGALFVVTAVAPGQLTFTVLLTMIGLLTMTFLLSANSLVQMAAPAHLRGRVMSVYVLALIGGQTLGGLLVGSVVDAYGARFGMAMNGFAVMTFGALCALGMAHQSHLRLAVRRHRFAPMVHIVPGR